MQTWIKRHATGLLAGVLRLQARVGNPARRLWAHARLAASIRGQVDPSVVVLGPPEVHGSGEVALGRNLYLYRELHLETRERGRISIGDDVVLSRGVHIVSFASVQVGAGTIIGEYTSVRDANHRFGSNVQAVRNSGHDTAPIVIGRNVWIGRGVTVLPGITIGDGSVIGANAVVTRSVAAGSVVAGVPARPLQIRKAA